MGLKLERNKKKNLLLSIIYRLAKILPLSTKGKFKLFLNLEWIFDRLSHELSFKVYNEDEHPFRLYTKDFILNKITSGQIVLDFGCKNGYISNYISQKAKMVVGVDRDAKAIAEAKSNYKNNNLEFIVGDIYEYLSKSNIKFDVLILSHIIEHLDEPLAFLKQFVKLFKYIYIEVPDFDKYYLNHYRKTQNLDLIYSDNDHIFEFDRNEIKNLINEANLIILQEEYIYGVIKVWCKVN